MEREIEWSVQLYWRLCEPMLASEVVLIGLRGGNSTLNLFVDNTAARLFNKLLALASIEWKLNLNFETLKIALLTIFFIGVKGLHLLYTPHGIFQNFPK